MNSPDDESFVNEFVSQLVNSGRRQTAFGEASRWGSMVIVQRMIDEGIPINGRTETGHTALMLAASGGQKDILQLLIDHGADVNVSDPTHGKTPLMWNLSANHDAATYLSFAQLLVSAGADTSVASRDGKTAQDWARERGSAELVRFLTDH